MLPHLVTLVIFIPLKLFFRNNFLIICVCVYVYYAFEYRYPQSLEEGVISAGTGIIGSCELLCIGAGIQTWVLCKSVKTQFLKKIFICIIL